MTFDRRVRAYSIDTSFALVLMVTGIIAVSYIESIGNTGKWLIVLGLYFTVMFVPHFFSKGQTFGKRTQKLKIIKNVKELIVKEYEVPPLYLLLLREFVKGLLSIFSLGFYLVIAGIVSSNREDGRTIHDFIFNTRVYPLTRLSSDKIETRRESQFLNESLKGSSYND